MTCEQVSLECFGTEDYETMLQVLAPSSAPVRRFMAGLKHYNLTIERG